MAAYDAKNPIRTVAPYNPTTGTAGTSVYVPTPSAYQYDLQDVSSPNAGRTEDALMHKQRIAQKVKIELSWLHPTTAEVSEILQAFNSQYLQIRYLDAKAGAYATKIFYVGDRSSPLYNANLGVWENVSFNIIER